MVDTLIRIVIVGLAGWRLASLLTYEDGPWYVFARLRQRFERSPEDFGPERFWAILLGCIWCTSVWTATAMWALWYVLPEAVVVVAAWAVAIAVERMGQRASA